MPPTARRRLPPPPLRKPELGWRHFFPLTPVQSVPSRNLCNFSLPQNVSPVPSIPEVCPILCQRPSCSRAAAVLPLTALFFFLPPFPAQIHPRFSLTFLFGHRRSVRRPSSCVSYLLHPGTVVLFPRLPRGNVDLQGCFLSLFPSSVRFCKH